MLKPITADDVVQVLDDEIERPALTALLNQRWTKKLTLISAPGGYGKTRALAQALRSNEADPVGVEFYVRCRAAYADPVQLANTILRALGADIDNDPAEASLPDRLVDELAILSPTKVVLILDDVHVLASSARALDLLGRVARELATNSHLVLMGRSVPELPLARLRADDAVVEIGQTELVFSAEEVDLLADRHGVDRSILLELAGWPALVRLAIVAGKAGPQNFLMQEILDGLAPALVRGLGVVTLAGSADQELLAACDVTIALEELADRVPMIDLLPAGKVQAHDLWSELGPLLVEAEERSQLVEIIASWHSRAGRFDEAIVLATECDQPAVARSVLMDALGRTDVSLRATSTQGWLDLFGGAASVADDDAELRLLRGWHARLEDGPGHGDADVAAALDLFEARGDARGEAYAAVENAFRGYMAGDIGRIGDSLQRGPRLIENGMDFVRALAEMVSAVIADISGDVEAALQHSLQAIGPDIRPEFVELALRHRATLHFLLGDSAGAVAATSELVDYAPSSLNVTTHLTARFSAGDIDEVIERWPALRYLTTGNKRVDFIHGVKSVFIDASLGLTPSLDSVRTILWERPRELVQQALCEWYALVIAGDEDQANDELAARIAELDLATPMVSGEVRRFLVPTYLAVPDARSYLEQAAADQRLGPHHLEMLGLARVLHALRANDAVDWSGYIDPARTISSMPLPWSVEIASGLVLHDEARGVELADALFAYTGAAPQIWLRTLADSDRPAAAGAQRLLAILPVPPSQSVQVITQGTVSLLHGDDMYAMTRTRVRQLLLVLALRGSISRDVAMTMLWPDKDLDNARNNLRITLSHLRGDLEPERRAGEPSFHLRQRGDDIVLRRSEHLHVDLWTITDALKEAGVAARAGDRPAQLRSLFVAAQTWQPPLLIDLVDLEAVRSDVDALQAQLVGATIEVAEALVSDGDYGAAEDLARKLLAHDRYHEQAHAVIIAAHLGAAQDPQALQAINECVAALAELGVAPSPATRMLMRRAQHATEISKRTA